MQRLLAILVLNTILIGAASADGLQYEVGVDGLACPFCYFGIEKNLVSIDNVEEISVDIKKGLVVITMAEGSELSEQLVRQKIKDAGFSVSTFTNIAEVL